MLKAVVFLMEEITSSTIVPPSAYEVRDCLLYLTMKVDPVPIIRVIAITVENRMSVSFHDLIKPMTKAVKKVAKAVTVRPIFSEIPSWMRLVSAVILVVISPAPSLSKKAMF